MVSVRVKAILRGSSKAKVVVRVRPRAIVIARFRYD
jgi:hypothetical protein